MRTYLPLFITALFIGSTQGLYAEDRVDERQQNQEQRIEQGVQSGSLTEKEANRLQRGQARIDAAEAKAEADGVVNPKEKRRLERMQDRQSKEIRRLKHNKRR